MLSAETLHIVTTVSNPIRWKSRHDLARAAISNWLKEPNVHVTIAEVAHGARDFELVDLGQDKRITHIPLRAYTMAWSKENVLNIAISRLPHDAKYIGVFDADVLFRKSGWASETIQALQLYPVIQPWKTAYDLGPNDSHVQTHVSFASQYHSGHPVVPNSSKFWKFDGGPYHYPHSGFLWAWVRDILDRIGGLFELGGMGSGDHHMALGLAGEADKSMPGGIGGAYRDAVKLWEARALTHVNRKIGYAPGTVEHMFHGDKNRRKYVDRWDMFIQHGFNPHADLKKNSFGVIEFSGNKPDLERMFDNYLRDREEDANIIG